MKLTSEQLISLYNTLTLLLKAENVLIVPRTPAWYVEMTYTRIGWQTVAWDDNYYLIAITENSREIANYPVHHLIPLSDLDEIPFGK